jgi:DNA polymerase I-like protein with 3'-5' exonuclease and polymerase domains
LIPPDGTKESHPRERSLCKTIVLAVNYGMGAKSLARKIRKPVTVAADLLRRHRVKYRRFWRWSDATVDFARAHRWLQTKYGWTVWVAPRSKETTWRNWRVQATGGEVLRAAVCALESAGFTLDATIHDAVLLEAEADRIDDVVAEAERLMVRASAVVLDEPLRVERKVLRPGQRLLEKGKALDTWERIWGLLEISPDAPEPALEDCGNRTGSLLGGL